MTWGGVRLPGQMPRLARQSLAIAYGDRLAGPQASAGLDPSDRAERRRPPRSRGKRPHIVRAQAPQGIVLSDFDENTLPRRLRFGVCFSADDHRSLLQ